MRNVNFPHELFNFPKSLNAPWFRCHFRFNTEIQAVEARHRRFKLTYRNGIVLEKNSVFMYLPSYLLLLFIFVEFQFHRLDFWLLNLLKKIPKITRKEHDYTSNDIFNKNFFEVWRKSIHNKRTRKNYKVRKM